MKRFIVLTRSTRAGVDHNPDPCWHNIGHLLPTLEVAQRYIGECVDFRVNCELGKYGKIPAICGVEERKADPYEARRRYLSHYCVVEVDVPEIPKAQ